MAITFALVNAKGGVGKTSSCHHLAGTLARRAAASCCWTPTPRPA